MVLQCVFIPSFGLYINTVSLTGKLTVNQDEVFFRKTAKGRREQQKVARGVWLWIRVSQWHELESAHGRLPPKTGM